MMRFSSSTALCLSAALLLAACGTSSEGQKPVSAKPSSSAPAISERLDDALEKSIAQAQATGDPQKVLAVYEQLLQIKPKDPDITVRYARALRDDKQLKKAQAVLAPFTGAENPHPDALTELAMIHLNLGQFKEAELRARETITLRPENGRAFLALGTALDAQGYHEQAETAFRRGIEYWRGDPAPILNNLALNLASQGKLEEALNVLDRAKEASPGRLEIERNYRIISALRETAGPIAPKPSRKPEALVYPQPLKPEVSDKPIPITDTKVVAPVEAKAPTETKPADKLEGEPKASAPRSVQKWNSKKTVEER